MNTRKSFIAVIALVLTLRLSGSHVATATPR